MTNSDKNKVDVDVTNNSVTVTVGDEKIKVTDKQAEKAGKQFLKTIGLTVALVAVGAIGGAILGAVLAPTIGWGILAGFGGLIGGGVVGAKTGGFLMKRTDAYKGLKKVAEMEAKKPGTFAKLSNALDKKFGKAQKAFKQANDNGAKSIQTQDNKPAVKAKTPSVK